jgi:hypothetical protein
MKPTEEAVPFNIALLLLCSTLYVIFQFLMYFRAFVNNTFNYYDCKFICHANFELLAQLFFKHPTRRILFVTYWYDTIIP